MEGVTRGSCTSREWRFVHQAFVKVNEAGTEAAVATAVVIGPTSVPTIRTVAIDRPFVLVIRDHATGALVFMGRVARP